MKNSLAFTLLISILISTVSIGNAHNPFTTKPEAQHRAPAPPVKNEFFAKIILWQHQLRQQMSELVRETKATGSPRPLFFLLGVAFVYGMVHSVGPGHGKVIALSYILTQRPRLSQGVLFGNLIALFHGISGILLVLIIRLLLQKSITETMENVSRITQLISFGLITCLGLAIFIHGIYRWTKSENGNQTHSNKKNRFVNPVLSSLAVGIIPCPGVVLVMLFALSMNMIGLGIIMGLTISLGMALTITCVVLVGLSGKSASLSMASGKKGFSIIFERLIELIAALAVTSLGLLFFCATI